MNEAQRLIDPVNKELESDRDSLASSQESEANSESGWTRDVRDSVDLLADTAPLIECLLIEDEVGNGRDGQPSVHTDKRLIERPVPVDISYLLEKYPSIDHALAQHLGEINMERLIRIQGGQFGTLAPENVNESPSIGAPTFKDSGLGSSVPSSIETDRQSLYSLESKLTLIELGARRAIPEMPKPGEPCTICNRVLPFKALTKKLWR